MKYYTLLFIGILLVLPQCGIQQKKIFKPVQKQMVKCMAIEPEWRAADNLTPPAIDNCLSMQEAIATGLKYNPHIQSLFEELGIAQADLVQAGFYTNPYVESIFNIPAKKNLVQTNISTSATFMLSDLWQVPFRKKVAQEQLEVKTNEIINAILELRKTIQMAYIECLYKQQLLSLIQEITTTLQDLYERIDYRYQFGFHTKLDLYYALTKLTEWQAKSVHAQAELMVAHTILRKTIGAQITNANVSLSNALNVPCIPMSEQELQQYALLSHPILLMENEKIEQAKASIRYERSRIIDNVQIGLSYERDFEKNVSGIGPAIGLNVPLFNTNYGNIKRAEFALAQAEKTLLAQRRTVFTNITNHLSLYNSYLEQIKQYQQTIIPAATQAVAFSQEFFEKMQIDMLVFINTQIDLLQSKVMLLDLYYKAAQAYIELEFNVGSQLQNINET